MRLELLLCAAIVVSAGSDGFAQTELDTFVAQLQRAAQHNDRAAMAAMVRYPLMVSIGGGIRIPIEDAATLLARYDDIFTPELRDAIARRTNDVTIQQINGEFRITSIAVPAPAEVGEPAAVPAAKTSSIAANPEPRRIAIRVGPRPTQVPGTLARGLIDSFVLYLPKGKLVSVRLERVPAGAAAIRVVHARTNSALNARRSADARFVSGRPLENGDYRIEVRRLRDDDGHLPYMLTISMR